MGNKIISRAVIFDLVQIAAAFAGIVSKMLLATDNIWGWILAIIGYVLVAIYNLFYVQLKILAVVVIGLAFLCIYGLVKWLGQTEGIQILDWVIVITTILFSIWLSIVESKNKAPLWRISLFVAFTTFLAWITLGMKINIMGWSTLLVSHALLCFIYANKKSWAFVVMQVISFGIAVWKLYDLLV